MTRQKPPMCSSCIHTLPSDGMSRCRAFPVYIPGPIFLSKLDHRQPIAGDNGFHFEQDPDERPLDNERFDAIFGAVTAGT